MSLLNLLDGIPPTTFFSGLFAPRVSQQYRLEQRRRRSQFDRGTSAAEREVGYVPTVGPLVSRDTNRDLERAPLSPPEVNRGSRCAILGSDVNNDVGRSRGRLALPEINGDTLRGPLALPDVNGDTGRAPLSPPDVQNGLPRGPFSTPRVNNGLARGLLSPDVSGDRRHAPFTPANVTSGGRQNSLWSPIDISHGLHSAPPRTRTLSQIWYEEEDAKRGPITS